VFYPDGTRLGVPADADADLRLAASQRISFDSAVPHGRAVYLPVDVGSGPCCVVVRTFVPDSRLQAGVRPASLVLIGLAVALLLTALLMAQWLARSLVRPLVDVADVARALHDGDLSRRAGPREPPEIAAIATTLNRLATRIDELLQAERETVADLSHRVRTPLTVLRLNVETLQDPDEAGRLFADVDEVERAVSQAITDARAPRPPATAVTTSLTAVVRARVAFWSVLARDQGRTLVADVPDAEVAVAVRPDDLEAVIDALVGNVLAHTPPGTGFRIAVEPGPPARLVVADDGPGLPEATLLERGRSGAGSSGLGLDIARRTADAAGGGLVVRSGPSGHGLTVVVVLGPDVTDHGRRPPGDAPVG
jgi:signal transduction histidine kinase